MKFIITNFEEGVFDTNNFGVDNLFRLDNEPIENVGDSITEQDIINWDSAFAWGDHSQAGYLTSLPSHLHSWSSITGKPSTFTPSAHNHSASDITSGTIAYGVLPFSSTNVSNWNTAHGWGNHANAGYLTSLPAHNHAWSNITNKPSTFTPSAHTHEWSDINNKPILDNYSYWRVEANGDGTNISSGEALNFVGSGDTSVSRTNNTITISSTGGTGGTAPTDYVYSDLNKTRNAVQMSSGDMNNINTTAIGWADAVVSNIPSWAGAGGNVWSNQINAGFGGQIWLGHGADDEIGFRKRTSGTWASWQRIATREWVIAQGYGSGTGGTADGNNYLTGVSGSGNGTVTFTRSGLSNLTWNSTHSHSNYVTTNTTQTIGGTKTFSNDITAPAFYESSLRLYKENIKPFEKGALDLIKGLEIVTFDRKDSEIKDKIGVIADDTAEEFLSPEKDAVDLYKTVFVQAKAIQELNRKVEQQQTQIEELKSLVEKLINK